MRRSLAAFALTLSAAALSYACEDDPGAGGTGGFDGGTGGFDASGPTPDPKPGDAGVADVEAPAPTSVTVRVTVLGQPVAGRVVVFHDANGEVIGSTKTGADGRATSTGAVPAMATALLGRGSEVHAVTWTQVAAGDELAVTDTPSTPASTPALDVSFGLVDGATRYDVNAGPCSNDGATSPVRVTLSFAECQRPTLPVLARTSVGADVRFAFLKSSPAPTDGGAGLASLGAFAAAGTSSVEAQNTPADPGRLRIGLTELASGVPFFMDGPETAPATQRSFWIPTGFADARQVYATFDDDDDVSHQTILRRGAPAASNTIDFAQRLPKITKAAVETPADPRRFELSWASASPLAAADGGLVRVRFYRPDFDGNLAWTFVVPPGAANTGSIKAPALPLGESGYGPAPADAGVTTFDAPEVLFVDLSTVPSYVAFRSLAATVVEKDGFGPRELTAVLPQDGTLRATSYWLTAR